MQLTQFNLVMTGIASLLLLTACADDGGEDKAVDPAEVTTSKAPSVEAPVAKETVARAEVNDESLSIMDQPVNFSTPEDVEKTFQEIGEKAGTASASKLKSTIGYLLTYDYSVGRDQDKLYAKLNGKTPNQIIEMAKR